MSEITATVQMDSQGRVVIPQSVRKGLNVDGQSCIVELDVELVRTLENSKAGDELPTVKAVDEEEDGA